MQQLRALLLFFVFHFLLFTSGSAQDSSRLRISLLTCTPGEELYSTFGHSAFRVIDSALLTDGRPSDIVYNYGVFDFDDAGFYIKFARGKLNYYVAPEPFNDENGYMGFRSLYQSYNRGITEQVLNLTGEEKTTILNFLKNNIKPENRYYKYDFFFDNCTTRLRDILKKQHDSSFCKKPVMPDGSRFRQAIHQYLDNNHKDWSKLSIDILLGLPCDAVMTAEQMQFLPDNLMKSLDSSDHKMVITSQNLYSIQQDTNRGSFFTPYVCFTLLFAIIFLLGFVKNRVVQGFLTGFDRFFFLFTGLLGIILVLMWTATDHQMCRNNFNLLWAWPTHAVTAFVSNKRSWVKKYYLFTAVALTLVLISWYFLPQQMNNDLVPVVALLIYRSAIKAKK